MKPKQDIARLKKDLQDILDTGGDKHPVGSIVAQGLRAEIDKLEGRQPEPIKQPTEAQFKENARLADAEAHGYHVEQESGKITGIDGKRFSK